MDEFAIQLGRLVSYRGKKEKVVIPDNVTVIGRHAFFCNDTVESVTIPASVETVEQQAFYGCNKLKAITFQGIIKRVQGDEAFGIGMKPEVELSVYSSIPIRNFSKTAQAKAVSSFSRRFEEFDQGTDVFRDDLDFIGKHLKQKRNSGSIYEYLVENESLRHAVLNAGTIPVKDVDWLLAELQKGDNKEFVAELLEYKNRQLQNPKVKKAADKAKEREEAKALSPEMTVADWRKLLRFGYENGDVVIKEVMFREPVIEIPDHIGDRKVRVIDRNAFAYHRKPGQTELWSPEKIILPEGIEEIRSGAFFCVDNAEIFIPSTVTSLPEGCFIAVSNLTVHIPVSVAEISDELEYDGLEPFKAFCAPAGSYAEQYAKEHNIPFVAE